MCVLWEQSLEPRDEALTGWGVFLGTESPHCFSWNTPKIPQLVSGCLLWGWKPGWAGKRLLQGTPRLDPSELQRISPGAESPVFKGCNLGLGSRRLSPERGSLWLHQELPAVPTHLCKLAPVDQRTDRQTDRQERNGRGRRSYTAHGRHSSLDSPQFLPGTLLPANPPAGTKN